MEIKNLIQDDDAVSPVIGVILMVAITVILAAVIGTFVLGLGDQVSNTSPSASFTFDYNSGGTAGNADCEDISSATSGSSTGVLTITHDGGDKITAGQLSVTTGNAAELDSDCGFNTESEITAGTSWTAGVNSADTLRVTWQATSGGDTATLGKWTGPDA